MNNIIKNNMLDEVVRKHKLTNGLEIYICQKKGYVKKIGMFGTKYGSIHNDFINILSNERIVVPDGIAHFLEHKLFEQEGANALDLFAKEGISSNAYTSFDHTVYFFETVDKFEKGLEMLIKLVKTPYFTKENVEKEKGIIEQEISMYDDDPNFIVYFNALRNMYINHPIRIDIAGTHETIAKIDKDVLDICYTNFYSSNNMFLVIIGDIDVEKTIDMIETNIKIYETDTRTDNVTKFEIVEPTIIGNKKTVKDMSLSMPQITLGYKLDTVSKDEIAKREVVADVISEMYFSKSSSFYEKEYNKGIITEGINFIYEGTSSFSHVVIMSSSTNPEQLEKDVVEYIEEIKNADIDTELFENIKKKKIGENLIASENLNNSYRRIIDSILNESTLYYDVEVLNNIAESDIKEFLTKLDEEKMVVSVVK